MTHLDAKEYRKAKIIVKELKNSLKELDHCINKLTPYKKYVTIRDSLDMLDISKSFVEINISKYEKILKTNFKVINNDG